MQHEEIHLKVLKAVEKNPDATQRELASTLGISLGKTNYCIQALVKKGWIKVNNFKQNQNKSRYAYLLTTKGIQKKTEMTKAFLKKKILEYETLKKEIEKIKEEQ